jgi:deoxyribodipyrimidine photo-lyase
MGMMTFSDDLKFIPNNPRVQIRREGLPLGDGRAVVYWMQRAQRVLDNPALELAIEIANLLNLPVVIYFSVNDKYPNANLRHYHFMQQGLRDVAADAAELGVGFVVRRATESTLEGFLAEVGAAILIGDENPLREPERWRSALAKRLKIPYWTVDADVVVPSAIFNRSYVLLHHFRPHLKKQIDQFLSPPKASMPVKIWKPEQKIASFDLSRDITEGFNAIDRSVQPVDSFTGGTHAALRRLKQFAAEGLVNYDERRNHPAVDGTSRLSPYLHFGNISPITIALAVKKAAAKGSVRAEVAEKFLDELIGWRELAILFVRHNPHYDSWECAEPWARKTLIEHGGDPRPHHYTLAQLERAETADELWNAAQREMVLTGYMHNYMRMYWAKKILEWAPDAARAFEWAVELNDRYELDGRDPNGYAGIAWAIVGKHDRPWFNRPIFGLIRPMSGAAIEKKTDTESYIRRFQATGTGR